MNIQTIYMIGFSISFICFGIYLGYKAYNDGYEISDLAEGAGGLVVFAFINCITSLVWPVLPLVLIGYGIGKIVEYVQMKKRMEEKNS